MQVEPDFNGLRSGHYNGQWGYINEPSQMAHEADLLPEKIYSMVSKLVDEDSTDIDTKQNTQSFQAKRNLVPGFYGGTPAWSDVPAQNNNGPLHLCSLSPLSDSAKDLVYAGLDHLDLSQNLLDFSFLSELDGYNKNNSKGTGENLDSGFASPAEKMGGAPPLTVPPQNDYAPLSWDWSQLSGSLDPDANQNYVNLFSQNPDLLDQIVRGDSAIDGLLDGSGLLQLDLLQVQEQRPLHNILPTMTTDQQNEDLRRNLRPMPNSSLLPNTAPSTPETFSPFRPPPELPFPNVNGPLGFNNNNECRPYPGVHEHPRNGFNPHVPTSEVPMMYDQETRNNGGDWRYLKGVNNPYGHGLVPLNNSGHPGLDMGRPNGLPRFSPTGPFRSPPPFLPPLSGRLPLYPPPMDASELYPLPCFPHHPLFPFQTPLYNLRQVRRNPIRDELSGRLDQCYEQFRQLEKERKKTEAELARHNPGKKLSSANSITVPRLPPSPTRVDRLVVDQLREHARVVTLVAKMERLRGKPMGSDVHSTLSIWDDAIRKVQGLRQEEVRCRSRLTLEPTENRAHQEEKGIQALAAGIHELSVASRHARTAMWACLMVTLSNRAPSPSN